MVAMWGLLLFVPRTLAWFAVAFLAFRLFDIWKPYPIRWFDRNVHGGLGAMLDDAVAGLFALVVVMGLQWLMRLA
jgi:phosphatidylglycerophosphatase A